MRYLLFLLLAGCSSQLDEMYRVDKMVNQVPYVEDVNNEWKSPEQFFREGGDCEDYAIAKFVILRDLGFKDLKMVAYETPEGTHMVLVVEIGGWKYKLDNREPIRAFTEKPIWESAKGFNPQ